MYCSAFGPPLLRLDAEKTVNGTVSTVADLETIAFMVHCHMVKAIYCCDNACVENRLRKKREEDFS